jgi:dCMP deaminase
MKEKFVKFYMSVAESTAQLSSAVRLKVGAILVKDDKIISMGYNGTPSGWDNVCENLVGYEFGEPVLKTKPETLHAESNCITKVARSTESSAGSTMFCTHAPCIECAKLIYQSGIKKMYYRDTYRDQSGVEFLQKGGVVVEHYPGT